MCGYISVQGQVTGEKNAKKLRGYAFESVMGMNVKSPAMKNNWIVRKMETLVLTVSISE